MNADGSGQRNVSNDPGGADLAPNFAVVTPRARRRRARPRRPPVCTRTQRSFRAAPFGTNGDDPGLNGNANAIGLRLRGQRPVHGWNGNDLIDGGPGNDTMYGDGGSDTIYARAGVIPDSDRLDGGLSSDVGFYDPGRDWCALDIVCRTPA